MTSKNYRLLKKSCLYLINLVFLFSSCQKDDDAIILSHNLKLISADYSNNEVDLKWNMPYINNFRYYYVFRYETEPNDLPLYRTCYYNDDDVYTCYYQINTQGAIAAIGNINTTSYKDYDLAVSDYLYYRVIAIGDTTLISNVIKVKIADVKKVNFSVTDAAYIPSQNSIALLSLRNNGTHFIYKYSISDSMITDSASHKPNSWTSGNAKIYVINTASGEKLLTADSYNLLLFNAQDLSFTASTSINNSIYGLCYNSNNIFYCDYNYVYSLNNENLNSVSSFYIYNYGYLYCHNNTLLSVESYSYPDYDQFTINDDGDFSNHLNGYKSINSLSSDYSPELGLLVTYTGEVYDFSFNKKGTLTGGSGSSSNSRYCFDSAHNLVARIISPDSKEVVVYSLDSYSPVKTIYPLGWPRKCLFDGNGNLIVISSSQAYTTYGSIIESFNINN